MIAELTDQKTLEYLVSGQSVNKYIIQYCIDNHYIESLSWIANNHVESLYSFVNNLISEKRFTNLVKKIVDSGYDIHKDNDTMFLFAAASKNYSLCKFLLERGSNIPRQVVNMYSIEDSSLKDIRDLLKEYNDKVLD